MRLFFAILLPDNVRQHLIQAQRELSRRMDTAPWPRGVPKIGWTKNENLHATVKFLGEVPDRDVPGVCAAVSAADLGGPFSLHTTGLSHFPDRGPISVIVADMAGDLAAATELAARVDATLKPIGFPVERRPYIPHVTIGRPREPFPSRLWAELHLADPPTPPGPPFLVESLSLMCSDLRREGPQYRQVAHFNLAARMPK